MPTGDATISALSVVIAALLFLMASKSNNKAMCTVIQSSMEVTVDVAEPPIRCNPLSGKEIFQLNLDLVNTNSSSDHYPLFSTSGQITFRLTYDKANPSISVYQTSLNKYNISFTDNISETIFYKRESSFPRQFKSVSAFYGTVDNFKNTTAYVRAFIHFVDCSTGHLYAFIRYEDQLYQVRPKVSDQSSKLENIHEILKVVSGLKDNQTLFTENSFAVQNQFNFLKKHLISSKHNNESASNKKVAKTENKYCMLTVLADKTFFEEKLKSNFQQMVIYVQTAIMLANEIVQNTPWTNSYNNAENLYGFALQNLHVNLSIGSTNNNLKTSETLAGDQIMNELFATRVSQKNSACLVHLLTGRHIVSVSNQNVTLSGLAPRGSLFQKDINVAVTSVAGHICEQQLWHVRCLLRFVHSLVHSMGAPKDAPTGDVHYLMGHSETITADSLKLSQSSINAIVSTVFNSSRKVMFEFVPASEASVCGNGVLEEGEQCDEGGGSSGGHEWGGDELCCDPKTCLLKKNAFCSPFNSLCCNHQCQHLLLESRPCMPWNYCNEANHFCQHKDDYCTLKKINVHCDANSNDEDDENGNFMAHQMHSNQKPVVFSYSSAGAPKKIKNNTIFSKRYKNTLVLKKSSNLHYIEFFVYLAIFLLLLILLTGMIIKKVMIAKRKTVSNQYSILLGNRFSREETNNNFELQIINQT